MFLLGSKEIVCPYCLARNLYSDIKKLKTCRPPKGCNRAFPALYKQEYKSSPPMFLQLTGWSAVGKSTYLQAVTLLLSKMHRFWVHKNTIAPITEETYRYMQEVHVYEATGKLPPPTQLALQDAYIANIWNMERWGSRTLVTRDVAGNVFQNKLDFPLEYIPYFLYVPTTIMMFSLPDMRRDPTLAANLLMAGYVNTLAEKHPNYKQENRQVVVVLTKSDSLLQEFPSNLKEYLVGDPFRIKMRSTPVDGKYMQDYLTTMHEISQCIREYFWNKVPGGPGLINLAEIHSIHLEFCVISSTGTPPDSENQLNEVDPLRVLDPLFWALEFQSF